MTAIDWFAWALAFLNGLCWGAIWGIRHERRRYYHKIFYIDSTDRQTVQWSVKQDANDFAPQPTSFLVIPTDKPPPS